MKRLYFLYVCTLITIPLFALAQPSVGTNILLPLESTVNLNTAGNVHVSPTENQTNVVTSVMDVAENRTAVEGVVTNGSGLNDEVFAQQLMNGTYSTDDEWETVSTLLNFCMQHGAPGFVFSLNRADWELSDRSRPDIMTLYYNNDPRSHGPLFVKSEFEVTQYSLEDLRALPDGSVTSEARLANALLILLLHESVSDQEVIVQLERLSGRNRPKVFSGGWMAVVAEFFIQNDIPVIQFINIKEIKEADWYKNADFLSKHRLDDFWITYSNLLKNGFM